MLKLEDDLYIADPWPAIYIDNLDSVIIADLHLGIEGVLEDEGLYIPRKASEDTIKLVFKIIEELDVRNLIIAGDLKHSFGLLNRSEWIEIKRFIKTLLDEYKINLTVIRGNHDNYLGVLLDKYNVPFLERLNYDKYTIIHGHQETGLDIYNKIIIMGHEHPSISISDELGIKYKFKCFLWGDFKTHKILILPPLSELATGTSFTHYEFVKPLSPLLEGLDLGNFKPYPVIPGELVKELPELKVLKSFI